MIVKCPKCGSTSCHPTWYTAYSAQCIPCGHEFDMRGGFWARVVWLWNMLRSVKV